MKKNNRKLHGYQIFSKKIYKIKDTGIGMSESALENIFEEFKQASNRTSSMYGGTGLGLNISKQISELLDAKLLVNSEEGKGSCFCFKLPCNSIIGTPKSINIPSSLKSVNFIDAPENDTAYIEHIIRYLDRLNIPYIFHDVELLKENKLSTDNFYLYIKKEYETTCIKKIPKKIQEKLIRLLVKLTSNPSYSYQN